MEDLQYIQVAAAVFAGQLLCCRFLKRWWLKILPSALLVGLIIACIAAYGASGWTNWGYLILLAILFGFALAAGAGWIVWLIWWGIARAIRKNSQK